MDTFGHPEQSVNGVAQEVGEKGWRTQPRNKHHQTWLNHARDVGVLI